MSTGRKIIFVIALMVLVGSLGAILTHYVTGAREEKDLESLKTFYDQTPGIQTPKGYVIGKYAELYKKNPDIIGWVKVNGTRIDYPVMQTQKDPQFYLRRNFEKQYSISGVPFMDALSDIFKPTANWMIYGHHMLNGTMFGDLEKYQDKAFWETHKTFQFDTIYKGGQGTYEVIAAFHARILPVDSTGFKYYNYAGITAKSDFYDYVTNIKKDADYDTGVTAKYGDQLVTLSTCSYFIAGHTGRFAVVGKRIK